jgi:hypothetical protein
MPLDMESIRSRRPGIFDALQYPHDGVLELRNRRSSSRVSRKTRFLAYKKVHEHEGVKERARILRSILLQHVADVLDAEEHHRQRVLQARRLHSATVDCPSALHAQPIQHQSDRVGERAWKWVRESGAVLLFLLLLLAFLIVGPHLPVGIREYISALFR